MGVASCRVLREVGSIPSEFCTTIPFCTLSCLIDIVRSTTGERPIARVPPSCFAMADLSPFQHGYGSLQIFSVHQKVPSGLADDFLLSGLRQDSVTTSAQGVFSEAPLNAGEEKKVVDDPEYPVSGVRHPGAYLPSLLV